MAQSSAINITWSGESIYELTASAVASDAIDVRFADMIEFDALYTPGTTAADLNLVVYLNPYDAQTDPNNEHWYPFGYWVEASTGNQTTNATGTWEPQPAEYNSTASTVADTAVHLVPIRINVFSAKQCRVTAEETNGSTAGTLELTAVKNNY